MKFYLKRRTGIKEVVLLVVLAFQALLLSIIDLWIPNPISGLKLGLANVITICTLIFFKFSYTLIILLGRCVFSSLFIGSPSLFMFSICGGILSTLVIFFMLKTMQNWFGITAISIAGSVANIMGQIIIAYFVMNDFSVTKYYFILLLSGIITGYFLGICSTFLVKTIKKLNLIPNL